MTRTLLASLLVACATAQHPTSTPAPLPTATPVSPPATPGSPPAAKPVVPPKPELIVWSEYTDFSGHGMNGKGRFYRHDAGKWVWAWCQRSFIADPGAGLQPNPTRCGAWAPVVDAQQPVLDGLLRPGYNEIEVQCRDRPELCRQLDVPITTRDAPVSP